MMEEIERRHATHWEDAVCDGREISRGVRRMDSEITRV